MIPHHSPSPCTMGCARASGTLLPLQRCGGRAEARPAHAQPVPRYDEGSGGSGDEGRDEAHKREWNLFYQKQMSLRKVKGVGSAGSQVASAHTLSSPSLVQNWVPPFSGQGASQALHVLFQGKDPKREEFVPPGQYRNAPRGLRVVSRAWMKGASLGGAGDSRAQKVVWKNLPLLPPDEDCPLKEASSRKIPRLTVKV